MNKFGLFCQSYFRCGSSKNKEDCKGRKTILQFSPSKKKKNDTIFNKNKIKFDKKIDKKNFVSF